MKRSGIYWTIRSLLEKTESHQKDFWGCYWADGGEGRKIENGGRNVQNRHNDLPRRMDFL